MRKAFSMLEFIMIVIVIGILASTALPRLERDGLIEATDQIVSHILYARHLAMQDDKFQIGDEFWFRKRWSVVFNEAQVCGEKKFWRYGIFFDKTLSGNLNSADEVAREPQNQNRYMSGGWAGMSNNDCKSISGKFNIGRKFGIIDVDFGGECGQNRAKTISFDEFGRPMRVVSTTGGGANRAYDRMLYQKNDKNICKIILKTSKKQSIIRIEPQTAFIDVEYTNL